MLPGRKLGFLCAQRFPNRLVVSGFSSHSKGSSQHVEEHSTNCPRNPGLRVLADWKGRGKRFLARRAAWSAWHHVELSPEGTSWPDSAKASLRGNGK